MDVVERVLEERAEELAAQVQAEVGLTSREARRLVDYAAPDLVASFRWRASGRTSSSPRFRSPPGRDYFVRDVLDAMNGQAVAEKVGIPSSRGWEALRVLVPAVVERLDDGAGGGNGDPARAIFDARASGRRRDWS